MKYRNQVLALCLAAALLLALPGCQGTEPVDDAVPGVESPEKELPDLPPPADAVPGAVEAQPPADEVPGPEVDAPSAGEALPGAETVDPLPSVSDEAPFETGDVPAMPLDEETTLLVTLEGMEEEAPAVFHYSDLGYSMVYDAALSLSQWENGDSYAAPLDGSCLAVTTVGLATEEEVLEGLKEQNGIEGEAGLTNFGAMGYEGRTLSLEADGHRVDWLVCRHNGTLWLIERSLSGAEAAEGWGSRFQAMVDTIEFL